MLHGNDFPESAGTDGILLGAETLRGLYPVDTIRTVGRICSEVRVSPLIYMRIFRMILQISI